MPKVLTKLRIDEISSVDRGAGENCRIVLFKRDDRKPEPRSDVRKAHYRHARGNKFHMLQNVSPEEAAHFLLHDPHGRQLRRDFSDVPFEQLVDHVCTASRRPVEKQRREAKTVDKHLEVILKSEAAMHALCKRITETGGSNFSHPEFDDYLARYAKNQHPSLSVGSAIAKVLSEETPIAKAYQTVHHASYPDAVTKATAADDDEDDGEDDGDDENGDDALEELNELAEQERRRDPKLSKAQAFTKIYADPENARLAQRERRQNRPRA